MIAPVSHHRHRSDHAHTATTHHHARGVANAEAWTPHRPAAPAARIDAAPSASRATRRCDQTTATDARCEGWCRDRSPPTPTRSTHRHIPHRPAESPRNEPRSSNASIHTTRQPAAAAVTANRLARRLPARIGPQITTTASPNTNGASPSERTTTGSADTARLRQLDEQLERTGTFVPIHIGTDGALLVKRLCRRRGRRRHERVSYRSR